MRTFIITLGIAIGMQSFGGLQRRLFNAVIEGGFHDDWCTLHYKILALNVDAESSIGDGVYHYPLYGKTQDFASLELAASQVRMKIPFLAFHKGVLLPYRGGPFPFLLERPRSVFLDDGRVFVEERMLPDSNYMSVLPKAMGDAKTLFENEQLHALFQTVVGSYSR
jgi:hypothetical protein